jgi:hypothetical protein
MTNVLKYLKAQQIDIAKVLIMILSEYRLIPLRQLTETLFLDKVEIMGHVSNVLKSKKRLPTVTST